MTALCLMTKILAVIGSFDYRRGRSIDENKPISPHMISVCDDTKCVNMKANWKCLA